jgi:hypothetical protein
VLKARKYGFSEPDAVASDGTHAWVANTGGGGSVTELNAATGHLVKRLSKSSYQFDFPCDIAAYRGRVWVANGNSDSVTEFPA